MSKRVMDSCCQLEIPFEYLDVEHHPTPSHLERNISKELVDVYLKTCTPIERVLFGRDKRLKGSGSFWINPEDRLKGQQLRMTPESTEGVQALTHRGILEIGEQIERKMEDSNRKLVDKAVEEMEELAKLVFNLMPTAQHLTVLEFLISQT